jgi:hypothetical protein
LQKLFWYHQVLGLADDQRLFGLFDSSIPSGGYSGWAKSNLKSAWTKPSGTTPSHEAGHLTGLQHVDCVGSEEAGGALDPTHPNAAPNCSLAPIGKAGYFGLTVYDTPFTIYSNDPAHPQAAFPLMSYASTTWSDAYHWCKMLTYYEVPCSPDAIGVPGIPIPNPTNVNVDCDKSVTGPGGIELKICLTDPTTPDYDNYPQLPPNKIIMAVPAPPQAWLLVTGTLTRDGGTITQAAVVDKLAPSLAALAATDEDAARRGAGGANEIVVNDSSGMMLARVKVGELGAAGHLSEHPITTHGNGGSETVLDATVTSVLVGSGVELPGGSAVRIKVIANDGVRTSESISPPFSVGVKAPLVAIGELPDGSTIPRYHLGDLTALGYDPEDGHLTAGAIAWRSNIDGDLGTGATMSLRRLAAGEHTITATATDSTGATGTDTIRLIVADTGAPAPRLEGAVPDAERRLKAGSAVPSGFGWVWIALIAVVAIAALIGLGYLLRRRRRAAAVAPSS